MAGRHTPYHPITPVALREPEAAQYLGLSQAFLRASRRGRGDGPPYIRVGRAVLYRRADLDAFLAARRVGGAHD